jgi:hypothetical protein
MDHIKTTQILKSIRQTTLDVPGDKIHLTLDNTNKVNNVGYEPVCSEPTMRWLDRERGYVYGLAVKIIVS